MKFTVFGKRYHKICVTVFCIKLACHYNKQIKKITVCVRFSPLAIQVPQCSLMNKLLFFLMLIYVSLLNHPVFSQQSRWQFIGRNDNGSLSYLEKSKQRGTGNKRQTWVKEVYTDGSYKIILIDWQCREKRFQAVEATNYAASGKYLDKEGSSPPATVVPDSVSENYYKAVCPSNEQQSAVQPDAASRTITAQIITKNANVREAPFANSPVVQTIEKGVRLILADVQPTGAWYQVTIPNTNATGWMHGSTIKLLSIKPGSNITKQKSKPAMRNRRAVKSN